MESPGSPDSQTATPQTPPESQPQTPRPVRIAPCHPLSLRSTNPPSPPAHASACTSPPQTAAERKASPCTRGSPRSAPAQLPVLPAVASTIVSRHGCNTPRRSASSTIPSAARSFTLPRQDSDTPALPKSLRSRHYHFRLFKPPQPHHRSLSHQLQDALNNLHQPNPSYAKSIVSFHPTDRRSCPEAFVSQLHQRCYAAVLLSGITKAGAPTYCQHPPLPWG